MMIYIRKQTVQEILDIASTDIEALNLFGDCGYTKEQLQAINRLLAIYNYNICITCDLGVINQDKRDLIYNIDIIKYLSNVRRLLVTNFPYNKELDSIEFVQYTPLLQRLSILGQIKKSISFDKLPSLKHLDSLNFDEYLDISKKQCTVINSLLQLKELEVNRLDAISLTPNPNMKRLAIFSKLKNGECLPDIFPNLEILYLKRQSNCTDFSFISQFENLKELYLYWTFGLETLPDLSKLQNLERLELYGCPNLYYGVEQISSLTKLRRFCASEQTRLTVEDFENVLQKVKTLKSIHITFRKNNMANKDMDKLMNKYNWKNSL